MVKLTKNQGNYNPKIVSFICNRSSYAMLKRDEFQFPDFMKNIRLICLGRISLSFLFNAFEHGADGILLIGCPSGECQYSFGNKLAEEYLVTAREIGHLLGIEKERLGITYISISEDLKFAQKVNKFIENVRKLGPSPLSVNSSEK